MKDGRSDPGHSKKRPQRADGAGTRRATNDPRRRSEAPRRDDRRREEPEPGFGPFRGSGRPTRKREDEARTVRSAAEEAVARASGQPRSALRIVHSENGVKAGKTRREKSGKPGDPVGKAKPAAKRAGTAGAAGGQRPKPVRDAARLQEALARGARALDRGYEQEALRMLRPWREHYPDSVELRELLGLTYYRLGRWALAQKELDAFVGLTDSTDQHPVLMDVARALGRYKRVDQLWEELRAVSPGAEIVTEGRIVYAGALADQGKLGEAIKVLERAPGRPEAGPPPPPAPLVRPGRPARAGRRHPGRPGPVPEDLGPGPELRRRRRTAGRAVLGVRGLEDAAHRGVEGGVELLVALLGGEPFRQGPGEAGHHTGVPAQAGVGLVAAVAARRGRPRGPPSGGPPVPGRSRPVSGSVSLNITCWPSGT